MEIRIVIFLFLVFVSVSANALLIWLASRKVTGVMGKVTQAASDFENKRETKAWLESLKTASDQALRATEAARRKLSELEPLLAKTQENYARTLSEMDGRLEKAAVEISTGAEKLRDAVAKPAFSVMAFTAGITQAIESIEGGEKETGREL